MENFNMKMEEYEERIREIFPHWEYKTFKILIILNSRFNDYLNRE
jgi:hypothetical protein